MRQPMVQTLKGKDLACQYGVISQPRSVMKTTNKPISIPHSLGMGRCGVMSIAGGGGKTSLMFHLAAQLTARGCRVLTTTTTKIFRPSPRQSPHVLVTPDVQHIVEAARLTPARAGHMTAARKETTDPCKLCGFHPRQVDELAKSGCFDWIIVEADGARRKPLKACASHEPVFPASTTLAVMVGGLDVLGKPLAEDWVFRSSLAAERIGVPLGERITETHMASLLACEIKRITGQDRYAIAAVLNKADTEMRRSAGLRVADRLFCNLPDLLDRVVITTLSGQVPLVYEIIPGNKKREDYGRNIRHCRHCAGGRSGNPHGPAQTSSSFQ